MNELFIGNNILFFFAQGAYFLLIAIFACKLLRQYRVRIKLFTGILLSLWVLLNIKDLIIYHTQVDSHMDRVNWITMIDQLAIPVIGISMFELNRPRSMTLPRATLHLLPFGVLLSLYCIFHSSTIILITIITATIYTIFIITATFLSLKTIPHHNPEYKAILNITYSFLIAISIWILSCIYPSTIFDMVYYIVSGIAWYIIYYNIENTYHLNNSITNDIATDIKEHPFTHALNKLFEQEHIFLNPDISISDVARLIGTNRSYLSEYLNTNCHSSFTDYINNMRLDHAEKLMSQNEKMSLDEISSSSGFNSLSTFRRAFVRKHGVTPSNYRHEHFCSAK
ncbi:MAG: helix-turn-helix transcriptional regulator [Muribaculaceae bacterium]|nr:helix-turn-helix transcriptional regulator [Muribaculaceae bacterium]